MLRPYPHMRDDLPCDFLVSRCRLQYSTHDVKSIDTM